MFGDTYLQLESCQRKERHLAAGVDVELHDETLKVGLGMVLSFFLTVEQHALSLGENYSRFYTGLRNTQYWE